MDYIVKRMKKEMMDLGEEEPFVIATGGLAKLIKEGSGSIDIIDSILTLTGLRVIYDKNKKPVS